jgi:predicted metal-dependent phosphoesterase TrpH
VIDLHTHTTASDGRDAPAALIARAVSAGVRILAVTDHDTVAGCAEARGEAASRGLQLVPGIEVTSVLDGVDVHVLGYFIDIESEPLLTFLADQRRLRLDRVREIVARLGALGIHLDAEAILAPGLQDTAKAAGRPWIARALVDTGHVATTSDAFDLWLGRGRPAFVPRVGVTPATVFDRVHDAGGLVSLAHPGLTRCDELIPDFVASGLDAIEAYHTKHDAETTARYRTLANRLGVAVTGGSDYHGDEAHGAAALGDVALPPDDFARLAALASSIERSTGKPVTSWSRPAGSPTG